jgi:hypothetical protein
VQSISTRWDNQPFDVSTQTILDTLAITDRRPEFAPRYKLLDRTLAAVPTGLSGPYGDDGDCTPYIQSGSIRLDSTQEVAGSATMAMVDARDLGFSAGLHRIQQFCVVKDSAGNFLFEAPTGIFYVNKATRSIAGGRTIDSFQMLDLSGKLSGKLRFINTYAATKGTRFDTLMRTLLQIPPLPKNVAGGTGQTPSGLPLAGPGITADRIDLETTTLALPQDQAFTDADTYIGVLNSLATSINYRKWLVRANGHFKSGKRPNLGISAPATVWNYATDVRSVIRPDINEDLGDFSSLSNIIKVKGGGAASAPFVSFAYNTTSDIGLVALQEALIDVIEDSGIPTQQICDDRAALELAIRAALADQVVIGVPPMPFLELYDPIGLTVYADDGSQLISGPDGFELVAYDLDLHSRSMNLQLGRYVRVGG